jgi:glucose/arabinose dehydrogenase
MRSALTLGWHLAAGITLATAGVHAVANEAAAPEGASGFVSYLSSGLSSPIGLMHAGDGSGRLFVIQQGGAVRVVVNDVLQATPLLTLTNAVGAATQCRPSPTAALATVGFTSGGERGLLGLAFHPDFAANGRLFVSFTDANGDTLVARFTMSDPQANQLSASDLASCVSVLRVDQDFTNHNGGGIDFGPDGYLYVGLGDGGSGGDPCRRGQTISPNQLPAFDANNTACPADAAFVNSGGNPDSRALLGTMMRLDVNASTAAGTNGLCASAADGSANYSIPAGNPFAGADPASACDEIWAYGLRNPWRWSFDRATGDMFIGDVGQNAVEEVSFEPAASAGGLNFGWNLCEGNANHFGTGCATPGLTAPIITYSRSGGRCSITGGYRYRGPVLDAQGRYFFGDYCTGQIWASDLNGGTWSQPVQAGNVFQTLAFGLTSFGEDEIGRLYVMQGSTSVGFTIWRLQGEETQPPFVAIPIGDQSDAEGESISLDVSGNFADPENDPLDFSSTGLPPGLDISPDGIISGTLSFDSAGVHAVTVSVSDGFGSASDQFTWTVANTNRPPELLVPLAPLNSAEGDVITLDLGPSFADPDGDSLAFGATGLPPGLIIDADGLITGFLGFDAAGSYTVTVTVGDGDLEITEDFAWTVANTNRPPELLEPVADRHNLEHDTVSFDLAPLVNDPDNDPLLFADTGSLPQGLSISAAGLISGTLASGSAGSHAVLVTVTDGTDAIDIAFTWTVTSSEARIFADGFEDAP